MRPSKGRGVALLILGGFLSLAAFGSLVLAGNAVAYLVGAGRAVEVTVTESSVDVEEGGEHGTGYYEQDGEHVDVHMPYVEKGEVFVARLPVIPLNFGFGASLITGDDAARQNLRFFIGTVVLGMPGYILLRRGRAMVKQAKAERFSSQGI